MKIEKRLFVTDFDGTVLNDEKTISPEDISTLRSLQERNIVTAIATGRSVYSFDKALKAMGLTKWKELLPIDYIIFCTGAGIMELPSGELIYQTALESVDIKKISAYFDQRNFDYMVLKAVPDTHYFLYKFNGSKNPDFHARLALYKAYALPLTEDDHPFEPATEVLAIIPGGADAKFLETIKKDLSLFSVVHATSPLDHQSAWIEVFHKNVSKSLAASWLVKKLGIKRQNVISVGNDYNDQDLLAWSGQGFIVENAPVCLKQQFINVVSNNKSGVTGAAQKSGLMD